MGEHLVAAFTGSVACSLDNRLLLLRGRERGNGRELLVYLAGCDAPSPPEHCLDAELYAPGVNLSSGAAGASAWRLVAGELNLLLPARSIHLHRPAADRFFAAVPEAQRTRKARLGWALLLNLLRLPGAARLLTIIRSR
jgi:hypothetical protein